MKTTISCAVLAAICGVATADLIAMGANADLSNGVLTQLNNVDEIRAGTRAITLNDPYQALLTGQSTAGAGFVTNAAGRNTNFIFNGVDQVHGTLVGSGATVNNFEASVPLAPNVLRAVSGMYTTNSTDLWVNGITIGGVSMTQGRHDVGGAFTGFTDGLLWDNVPGEIISISIFSALFIDGTLIATSSPLTNLRTAPEMGSAVVWNGVVGSGIDEVWMVFDIEYVIPAPGAAALLGLGGLLASRRRR